MWHNIDLKYVFFNDNIPREVAPPDFYLFIAKQPMDYNLV